MCVSGWFVKGGQITDKTADEYKDQIPLVETVLKYGRPCAFVAGGLLYALAAVLMLHIWHRNYHREQERRRILGIAQEESSTVPLNPGRYEHLQDEA